MLNWDVPHYWRSCFGLWRDRESCARLMIIHWSDELDIHWDAWVMNQPFGEMAHANTSMNIVSTYWTCFIPGPCLCYPWCVPQFIPSAVSTFLHCTETCYDDFIIVVVHAAPWITSPICHRLLTTWCRSMKSTCTHKCQCGWRTFNAMCLIRFSFCLCHGEHSANWHTHECHVRSLHGFRLLRLIQVMNILSSWRSTLTVVAEHMTTHILCHSSLKRLFPIGVCLSRP